ncbi:MAG: midcut-by-XrtH protein [Proteobacteria bacterium]|nr:midcut-by-XrtH protein [Pseudomonadota bacterium]
MICIVMTGAVALVGTPTAWAGIPAGTGTIGYSPFAAASAPALGTWMLALLAMFFAVVAYRALRERANRRLLGHLLLGTGILAGGAASKDLIGLAEAVVPVANASMTMISGGSTTVGYGITLVTNTSGVPQQINALTVNTSGYIFTNPGSSYTPQCLVGTVVTTGGTCYVDLISSAPPP